MEECMQIAVIIVQVLLALAFLMAGSQKLVGAKRSVENRDQLRVAPWFWTLTGVIEVLAALFLVIGIWVHVLALVGAALLAATMVGAFFTNMLRQVPFSHAASNIVLFALAAFVIAVHWPDLAGIIL